MYRNVKQGTCENFTLTPKDALPANIGSDGATFCVVFYVPTKQGNALVGHIDSDAPVKVSSGAAYDALVSDVEKRVRALLGSDTVDPAAIWATTKGADKFASAMQQGIMNATGVRKTNLKCEKGEGLMVKVENGKPGEVIWALGNAFKGYTAKEVAGSTLWTNSKAT
ncbi:hypothetical protein MY5147_009465 [Beauveria neobassiana]